jgi:hypothetical protein
MNWLFENRRRHFWIVFAVVFAAMTWRMARPWNTDGWSAPALAGTAALYLGFAIAVAAAFALVQVAVTDAIRSWQSTGWSSGRGRR